MLTFTNPDIETTALNRRESLIKHLQHPLLAPTNAVSDALTPKERAAYDRNRMDYLSGGIILGTETVHEGKLRLTRAFQENRARNSGHAGVILSGNSSMGKTTTAKRLMRWVFEEYTKQVPEWEKFEHVPVMYVEVPSNSNGKSLLKEMAEFLGLPIHPRDSLADLRTKVVAGIRRARTQLIVVDELHMLSEGRSAGLGESVDLLKGLHNDLSATFLYAGIDVTTSNLMSGTRGQQLASRFSVLELKAYTWSDKEHRLAWRRLVKSFEAQLQLRDHPVGTLNAEAEYLWQRTGGSIGALSRLLTGTAIDLIQNRATVEKLERDRLDDYTLDRTSEEHYKAVRKLVASRGMTAMEKVMA